MEISVAAVVEHDSGSCWAIDFKPGTNAYPDLRATVFRVLVSQSDRCAREIVRRSGHWGTDGGVISLAGNYLVYEVPAGYPLHFLPHQSEGKTVHDGVASAHGLVLYQQSERRRHNLGAEGSRESRWQGHDSRAGAPGVGGRGQLVERL